jgi:hypothetical protein
MFSLLAENALPVANIFIKKKFRKLIFGAFCQEGILSFVEGA